MKVLNDEPFSGSRGNTITAVVTGTAKLQMKAPDGTWVDVPDGAVTASTVYSFHAPPGGAIFRFTDVTGTVGIAQ